MSTEPGDQTLGGIGDALRKGDHVVFGDSVPDDGVPIPIVGMIDRIETLASQVRQPATRLKELMTEFDCVAMLDAVRYAVQPPILDETIPDNATEIFSWDAKIEYLQGLAVTSTRGARTPSEDSIREVMDLTERVFEAEQAKVLLRSLESEGGRNNGVMEASLLLGLENLTDRMQGYSKHLDEIYSEVFCGVRSECESEFGFCPADVAGVVRSVVHETNFAMNSGRDAMFDLFEKYGGELPEPDAIPIEDFDRIQTGFRVLLEPSIWDPSLIASWAGEAEARIEAMLAAMSTSWESQQGFLVPSDTNRVRTHPVVPLGDGTFWVPRVWDLLHGLLDWWNLELRERNINHLKTRYERARDSATELLAERVMINMFGSENVFASQHFDGPRSHGEVDVLGISPDCPIAIEAKAASMTARGRLGVPDRVERVAGDVVVRAHEQLANLADYVAGGGRMFAEREGGSERRLLADRVIRVVPIVVTFERMDPLASRSAQLSGAGRSDSAWVVSLADIMMVAEVLPNPTEFLGYADSRAQLASGPIRTYMESDVLGLYLEDRLHELTEIGHSDGTHSVSIGYSSTAINAFFTAEEMGLPATRPMSGVPAPILDLLGAEIGKPGWGTASLAVMRVHPRQWRKWQKFVRRRRNRGQRTMEFEFEAEGLMVSVVESDEPPISVDPDGQVTIRFPATFVSLP